MNKRTKIEFWSSHYGSTTLFYNHKSVDLKGCYTEILLKIGKGFKNRIADGDTIYFITDNQLKKLELIIQNQ